MTVEFPLSLLIQFAKVPVLGQVKTRMQPVLTEQQSLALHCYLVERTHHTLHQQALCKTELWLAGGEAREFFESLKPCPNLKYQRGSDLGERMHRAIATGLECYGSAVLIGSDCPGITPAYLREALLALEIVDVVLGPAVDGGYVLIGMNKACPGAFGGIDWGTDQVLRQTKERLQGLGLTWFELPVLPDIDRPEDLQQINPLSYF